MIVGACGFGSTGSSAVTDYLKEFDSFQVLDKLEFDWVGSVDSLIDLDFHLNHPHNRTRDSIEAIYRYKQFCNRSKKHLAAAGMELEQFDASVGRFLDAITLVSWKWTVSKIEDKPIWERIFRKILSRFAVIPKWEIKHATQWHGYPYEEVSLSVFPQNFDTLAKQHVKELLGLLGVTFDRPCIIDQPFPGNNPQACFKFYDDPYAIIVDRDPRDNYVFAKTKLLGRNHFMPVDTVEDFVKYYKAIRENQPYRENNDRILSIKFEDMVYHYDDTTSRIREFLSLPENPAPKSIFDPAISMPNTQVWRRFPQFDRDIKYIEKNLQEYLFDYTGCPIPDLNAPMFRGKSPRNK